MPARQAREAHPKLVADSDLMVPGLTDEIWDWLREHVHSKFELVSVGDGQALEEDFIVFEDYSEFLHFRLRWEDGQH